jgi:hypothetical protein
MARSPTSQSSSMRFALSGNRRGLEATAPSRQAAAPRKRKRDRAQTPEGAPNALHRRRPRPGRLGERRPRQARALLSLLATLHRALPSGRSLVTRGSTRGAQSESRAAPKQRDRPADRGPAFGVSRARARIPDLPHTRWKQGCSRGRPGASVRARRPAKHRSTTTLRDQVCCLAQRSGVSPESTAAVASSSTPVEDVRVR